MKISELIKNHVAAFAVVTTVVAFALPLAAHATEADQGGAGMNSGDSSSQSGYTVNTSSPASVVPAEIPSQDAGGSGATSVSGSAAGATLANQVKGTIDSIDAARRSVTIRDSEGNLSTYKLKSGADMSFQGHKATLSTFAKGDSVVVTPAANDPAAATAISAGS
jgi:hypothetical protein